MCIARDSVDTPRVARVLQVFARRVYFSTLFDLSLRLETTREFNFVASSIPHLAIAFPHNSSSLLQYTSQCQTPEIAASRPKTNDTSEAPTSSNPEQWQSEDTFEDSVL